MNTSSLSPFHPLIQQWFAERYSAPTDIQSQVWPLISKGHHVLMTAPTGSGKTLAAFLWPINQLLINHWQPNQIRVLYISPLKALNNDIQKNLIAPLKQIQELFNQAGFCSSDIRVQTRSGDTPSSERQKMIRKPPEILITTPESLNIMLSSKKARMLFSGLAMVIMDEIHAVASNKRGTHLITAVDRLVHLSGEFQRIGISATVRPLNKIADFIAGYQMIGTPSQISYLKRPIQIVQTQVKKSMQVKVCFPNHAHVLAHHQSIWPALTDDFVKIIHTNQSTLFFTNSRRLSEKITRFINETYEEPLAFAHHGSLSKEMRLLVENKLKQGDLKAIVATSSLELGIDIGNLNEIVLIQTPFQISSAIQKLGRSGHNVNDTSQARIFPTHGRDCIHAAVMAQAMINMDIESIHIPICPLDMLAQIIISMTGTEVWDIDELFQWIKCSYPFHELSHQTFHLVLDMLNGRFADTRIRELRPRISIDQHDRLVRAKEGALRLLYFSGGTIPDRGYYNLRVSGTNAKIGDLDEEFVWERSIGDTFIFGTQTWQVNRIDFQNIFVSPVTKTGGMPPFWRGDLFGRDFYLSEKIAYFLKELNAQLDITNNHQEHILNHLQTAFYMDESAARVLIDFLSRQKQSTQSDLPHRHHILIEHFSDPLNRTDSKQVILHTIWGGKINQPYAIALSQSWEDSFSYPLQFFYDDDCIVLNLPHDFSTKDLLNRVTQDNMFSLLRNKIEKTNFFGARFRDNAARALLLPKRSFKKRTPLWFNRLRSKKLLEAVTGFEDFPILAETWRTCLQDDFDLHNLTIILNEIQEGMITFTEVFTHAPSPFTNNVLWQQMNKLMYEDDTPNDSKKSKLRHDIFTQLVLNTQLRPKLLQKTIDEFTFKTQRKFPGYGLSSIEDLMDVLKDRLVIPENEWEGIIDAMRRDHDLSVKTDSPFLKKRMRKLVFPNATISCVIAIENEARIHKYLSSTSESFAQLLKIWLSYYGPMSLTLIKDLFGVPETIIQEAINQLIHNQTILKDQFTEEQIEPHICDVQNLEILLRIQRKSNRQVFRTLDIKQLPLFLATWHGLTQPGQTIESFQTCIEKLIGYPSSISLWETDIFPSRIFPYYTQWLDTIIQQSDLTWFGYDKKKLVFNFESEMALFNQEDQSIDLTDIFQDSQARYRFAELLTHSTLDSQNLTKLLWDNFFKGVISTDSYASIRHGIESGFKACEMISLHHPPKKARRIGFSRWKSTRPLSGHWFVIQKQSQEFDLLEKNMIIKSRIRQLFDRYGIIFRELLLNELPLLQWSSIFNTLRLMEFSGEIFSGYFFEGISGIQFISHEAYRFLQKPLPQDCIYWMNAADPISMCGIDVISLKKELPKRLPSTHLVFHGKQLMLISEKNGKQLTFNCHHDAPMIQSYLSFFKILISRPIKPFSSIRVETINDYPVLKSDYQHVLLSFGFYKDYKGMILSQKEYINSSLTDWSL